MEDRRVEQGLLGHHAHDLRTGDLEPFLLGGLALHFLVGRVQADLAIIEQVHAHLSDVHIEHHARGLGCGKGARHLDGLALLVTHDLAVLVALGPAALADIQGDGVGLPLHVGVHVDVVGDEEVACAGHGHAALGHELEGAVVGLEVRVLHLLGKGLVLALADVGHLHAVGPLRALRIQIDGNAQFLADAFADLVGQFDAVVPGRVLAHGNEGNHVACALAGMFARVLGHVDELGARFHSLEHRLQQRLGLAHDGVDRAVEVGAGIHVKQRGAFHLANGLGDGLDDPAAAAFTEIGNALDDLGHGIPPESAPSG